jgi:hypothetical protein
MLAKTDWRFFCIKIWQITSKFAGDDAPLRRRTRRRNAADVTPEVYLFDSR